MWTTPDVCSGARDMSKINPEAQRCAATKRTTGLPTEAAYWAAPMWPTPDTGHERINRSASAGAADRPTIALAAKLWMTPTTQSAKGVDYQRVNGKNVLILDGQAKALMEQWPTPRATDGTKGGPNQAGSKGDLMLPSAAAQWATPGAGDDRGPSTGWEASAQRHAANGVNKQMMLRDQAPRWQWPTPASRDYRTPNSQSLQERGQGTKGEQLPNFVEHHFSHQVLSTLDGRPLSPTGRTLPRRLNPAFACWLMGWPIWWTNPALTSCVRSEMASYRCRLQWHLSSLCGAHANPDP